MLEQLTLQNLPTEFVEGQATKFTDQQRVLALRRCMELTSGIAPSKAAIWAFPESDEFHFLLDRDDRGWLLSVLWISTSNVSGFRCRYSNDGSPQELIVTSKIRGVEFDAPPGLSCDWALDCISSGKAHLVD